MDDDPVMGCVWEVIVIANQLFVDMLTIDERVIMFSHLEHLPCHGSRPDSPMSWYQFEECDEIMRVNAEVNERIEIDGR